LKKAFTLIEVMVATVIVFIAISAIMNVVSNNKKLIQIFLNNKFFALKASVAFVEDKDVKNNYDRLIDFHITNDKIIHILKKDKINLDKEEDYQKEYNFSNALQIIMTKLKAYDTTHSVSIYSIGIR